MILAAIVFVAASWDAYAPVVRAGFLILFAAFFAWLGVRATRHDFATIGGSLGVVAVGFAGVAQLAWRMDEGGAEPFTITLMIFTVAAAGVVLDRTRLRAVGATAAVAVPLAVLALAIEFAASTESEEIAAARFVIVTSLAGPAFVWLARLWSKPLHRGIVMWSGASLAIVGAVAVIGLPYAIDEAGSLALLAMLAGIGALVAIARWRPLVGAGPLTGVGVVTTVTLLNAVTDVVNWGWRTDLVLAVMMALMVLMLTFGTQQWRIAGLAGLGVPVAWLTVLCAATGAATVVASLFGPDVRSPRRSILDDVETTHSLAYAGILVVLAGGAWLMRAWRLGARAERLRVIVGTWLSAAALVVGGFGAYKVSESARWLNAPGIVVSAIGLWIVWTMWGPSQRRPMRLTAVAVGTVAAVLGPVRIAAFESGFTDAEVTAWGVSVVVAIAGLVYARRMMAWTVVIASLATTMLVAAVVWRFSESIELTVVAAALSSTVIAGVGAIARVGAAVNGPARDQQPGLDAGGTQSQVARISASTDLALIGALPALAVGALYAAYGAAVGSVWALMPSSAWTVEVTWAEPTTAGITVLAGVLCARSVRAPAMQAVSRLFVGLGLIAFIPQLSGLVARHLPASEHPWLTVVVLAVALAAWSATALAPLRHARIPVAVAGVVATSAIAVNWLARMAVDGAEWRIIVALLVVTLAGFALGVRWPVFTLAPALATASLIAPAALVKVGPWAAVLAATANLTALVWIARLEIRRGARPTMWLAGALPTALVGAGAAATSVWMAGREWLESRESGTVEGHYPALVIVVLVVVSALAWPQVRRHGASVILGATVVAAGLVPSPAGWVVLAVLAPCAAEAGARWNGRAGLQRLHGVLAIIAAAAWMPWRVGPAAIVETLAVAVFVVTALRAAHGSSARITCAIGAPLIAVLAAMHGLIFFGTGYGPSALGGATIGLTVAIALVAGKVLGSEGAAWVLGAITVVMPFATTDILASGLLLLIACAAWYALFAFNGVPWARITALWLLSPAAALLLAAVGATALEAYVAVPGATVLGLGLIRMRRDATIRTYAALAPGLGLILIPSYVAMALEPNVLVRPLALVAAAGVLGAIGVWRQWFAPLLATAVTAVVLATSQVVVDDALVPRWVSFGFIGAVLLVLGFTAERIRTMR